MSKTNSVRLIGRFGVSPELKTINTETCVSSFSFATNDSKRNADGTNSKTTEWHNVICFNSLAKLVTKHCKQGDQASLEGRLRTRKYDDQNGVTRYATEIILEELLFLSSKHEN